MQQLAQAREAAQQQRLALERQMADHERTEKERAEKEHKRQEMRDLKLAEELRWLEEHKRQVIEKQEMGDLKLAEELRRQEELELARQQEVKTAETRRLDSLERFDNAVEELDLALGDLDPEDQIAILAALYGQGDPVPHPADRADVKTRKESEEAASLGVFRGVHRGTIAAATLSNGAVQIGSQPYARKECGASHGGHSNLCGYLSFEDGNGPAALQLKQRLAPLANEISHDLGRNVDFASLATMMENEVVMAYVITLKTPVCVYNSVAQAAVTYRTDDCVHDMVYLHCDGGHFQRLVRA